ncbi:uncharacterized protein LOC135844024 [Planococcus citri]|uniref:uncharacterized protein LOC135844024 n=1 Tax=Planococcus citri TaxID=170843 RepID=UPI0031F884A6
MILLQSRESILKNKKSNFDFLTILHIALLLSLLPNSILSFGLPTTAVDYETDNFIELRLHNKFFVDKSLLIEELLQYHGSIYAQTVARPPGWGKSINLHMLEKFFEIEVDEKGNLLPKDKTINDKLFLGGTIAPSSNEPKHLEPLRISKSSNATKHLGKHPVILLRLKNATGKNYAEMETNLKACVVQAFERHKYLTYSSKITNKGKFEKYLKGDFHSKELQNSLHFLGLKLWEHFGQYVIVLVDDYDIPLVNAYSEFKKEDSRDSDKIRELLRYMLSAARKRTSSGTTPADNNPNTTFRNSLTLGQDQTLNTAFLTGVLDLIFENLKEKHFFEFLKVHTLFDAQFSKFYGFTDEEVKQLLTKVPEGQVNPYTMKLYYNGYPYTFQRQEKLHFYKSISVMRCLFAKRSEYPHYPFELNIGLIRNILSSNEMQEFVQSMIANRSEWLGGYQYTTSEIRMKRTIPDVLSDHLTILIFYGFLSSRKPNIASYDNDPNVGIPNIEMRSVYEAHLFEWVYNKFNTTTGNFLAFSNLLYTGNKTEFAKSLQEYISKASEFIRSSEYNAKISYDGFMLALKTSMTNASHEAQDIKENGDTRDINDILLTPRPHMKKVAIAIRYKVINEENDLSSVAEAELGQINQEYMNGTVLETMYYPRVEKCFKIGIAFCGDKVEVRFEISEKKNLTKTLD